MRKLIVIVMLLAFISVCMAGFVEDFYRTAVAEDYTNETIQTATLAQIINNVYPDATTDEKLSIAQQVWRGIGKIKTRVVTQRRKDTNLVKKLAARDKLREVYPHCTFQQIGSSGNVYEINLSGDPNDI